MLSWRQQRTRLRRIGPGGFQLAFPQTCSPYPSPILAKGSCILLGPRPDALELSLTPLFPSQSVSKPRQLHPQNLSRISMLLPMDSALAGPPSSPAWTLQQQTPARSRGAPLQSAPGSHLGAGSQGNLSQVRGLLAQSLPRLHLSPGRSKVLP